MVFGPATGVVCNGGRDLTVVNDGQAFQCSAASGETWTITVPRKSDSSYIISQP